MMNSELQKEFNLKLFEQKRQSHYAEWYSSVFCSVLIWSKIIELWYKFLLLGVGSVN